MCEPVSPANPSRRAHRSQSILRSSRSFSVTRTRKITPKPRFGHAEHLARLAALFGCGVGFATRKTPPGRGF